MAPASRLQAVWRTMNSVAKNARVAISKKNSPSVEPSAFKSLLQHRERSLHAAAVAFCLYLYALHAIWVNELGNPDFRFLSSSFAQKFID